MASCSTQTTGQASQAPCTASAQCGTATMASSVGGGSCDGSRDEADALTGAAAPCIMTGRSASHPTTLHASQLELLTYCRTTAATCVQA